MTTVVGAAIVVAHGGKARVLVGQRSAPAALAGRWEFPGGKVEPGETDAEALIRECREELAVEVVVGPRLGADLPIPGGRVLRVHVCRLIAGEPTAHEHAELRWVDAAALSGLPWLETNRPLLPALAALLRISSP